MQETVRPYDLVIVGASFAGLVAARTAAMRGLSVAVLDAKPEAGHRVATTGILVKEAADEIDIPHALTRRVHGVRLYAPNHRSIDLFAPGYFFLTTDTANVLRWLASEAMRAGAKILYRARFEGASRDGGVFRFHGLNIAARYILGADGARSAVARAFGLGRNTRFLTGIEVEYEGLSRADPRFLHCFLDSKLAPGYLGWVAPGPSVTQAGLAVGPGRRPDLKRFLAATEPIFGYAEARAVERRSGRIPAGGLVSPWSADGVMLVGDAAGQVSPATGGGIKLAFELGRRSAQLIADHLQDMGAPPPVALASELPAFTAKKLMRAALDMAPPNPLIDLALTLPPMRWLAQHVYFHRRGGKGLSFAEFEARMREGADETSSYPKLSPGA
ncbi:MAG: NAD(P)/FAD-dependent oxidoreductase [Hyphomicrobium sp.]|jgi:digeranylgeranylglycerophospholipid reductase|uniref:NAD(P)/FAD-dependent oxidoreductase n=1 Tax=Hyphomicrobium sp. TaxID=82 RepID=UPI0025BDD7A4|nr:NAD(P)/FAD-dependent oxidoreductase [Hyphomicrobium sp.]MBX9863455.1 NAD(P)/FAD-dependent oxidoreductase [Hyphomicrobium sp.]